MLVFLGFFFGNRWMDGSYSWGGVGRVPKRTWQKSSTIMVCVHCVNEPTAGYTAEKVNPVERRVASVRYRTRDQRRALRAL